MQLNTAMNVLARYSHTRIWKPKDVCCIGGRDGLLGQAEGKRSIHRVGGRGKEKREREVQYGERWGNRSKERRGRGKIQDVTHPKHFLFSMETCVLVHMHHCRAVPFSLLF
jgi:hypothetical protein